VTALSPGRFARSALAAMLAWDVCIQARYGFYAVYAVVTGFYLVVLDALPASLVDRALVLVVVTDTAVLGFYFIGALVLIEKREGVLDALLVTPLGLRGYLLSKAASLTLLATLASGVVVGFTHGTRVAVAPLLAGVALTASLFVLVGVAAVARFDTVNRYFFGAVLYGAVLYAPVAGFLGVFDTAAFALLPLEPALVLVNAAFQGAAPASLAYAVAYLLVGNVAAFLLARHQLQRHVVADAGAGTDDSPREPGRLSAWLNGRVGPIGGLALADARNWVRDPTLLLAASAPLALGALSRVGLPLANRQYLPGVALEPFYPVALAFLVGFPPYIYGFIVGFFVLEDREQGTLTALAVSPLTARGYLVYRGATAYALGVVGVVVAVAVFGLETLAPWTFVGVAAVAGLAGPVSTFLFAALASDSIEGLAINKLLATTVVVPALAILAVPTPLEYAAGLVPVYWPMKAAVLAATGGGAAAIVGLLAVGAAYLGACAVVLARRFAAA